MNNILQSIKFLNSDNNCAEMNISQNTYKGLCKHMTEEMNKKMCQELYDKMCKEFDSLYTQLKDTHIKYNTPHYLVMNKYVTSRLIAFETLNTAYIDDKDNETEPIGLSKITIERNKSNKEWSKGHGPYITLYIFKELWDLTAFKINNGDITLRSLYTLQLMNNNNKVNIYRKEFELKLDNATIYIRPYSNIMEITIKII